MDQNNEDRGIDLSHALDDSSSRVKFEGEEFQHSTRSFQAPTPKIVQWVINYSGGAIKDEKQASYVLVGFVVATIIVTLFFIFGAIRSPSPPPANQIINVAGPDGKR